MLVHGGVGPEITWERQAPLAERWRLVIPSRRGYAEDADPVRQDFENDAKDLAPALDDGAHLVGFSYGGLGSALLAGRDPARVRSLTLVEVPMFALAGADPEVARMRMLADAFIAGRSADPDPKTDALFLEMAGVGAGSRIDPAEMERLLRLTQNLRPPVEAVPDVEAIRASRIPVMVVSGDHNPGIERLCDLIADAFGARREILAGAGHAVPRARGFNDLLEDFLLHSEAAAPQ